MPINVKNIKGNGLITALVFYGVVGIICVGILPSTDFAPHISIIGILNLITVYGLFKKRAWTIWFITTLFFVASTFSLFSLYFFIGRNFLLELILIIYLVLTWIFTSYLLSKRKTWKT
jgi:hypothetical protein